MSVKVDLGELGQHLQRHPFAYLLTVGEDLRAHAVAVQPTRTMSARAPPARRRLHPPTTAPNNG